MFSQERLDDGIQGHLTEKGISVWGEYVYYKDESLDEYLERCTFPKSRQYPLSFYDIVDEDNWFDKNDVVLNPDNGNFEPMDWDAFTDEYIDDLDDNTVLVCVDYHM